MATSLGLSGLQGHSFQYLNITYDPLKQSWLWDGECILSLINHATSKFSFCNCGNAQTSNPFYTKETDGPNRMQPLPIRQIELPEVH